MTAPELGVSPVRLLACGKPACIIEGCDEHASVRDMCPRHDYRVAKHGDPHWQRPPAKPKPERKGPPPPRTCIEDGCDLPTFGKHRCQAHFVAMFLNNIPGACFSPT